ncbi:MAG: S-adenosylmethionine decarboxylase family protein [Polyangiales bacterium]
MSVTGGLETIVDAYDCAPDKLRDSAVVRALFEALIADLSLHPVAPPIVHEFPGEAGLTAVVVLSESHLTLHTFPELGLATLNLYCCRARPRWPWSDRLATHLGSKRVTVREIERGATP